MIVDSVFQKMSVKKVEAQSFQVEWSVPADLPYLQGHFPGNPVFPAVGILDASVYALKQRLPQSHLHAVVNAKFLSLIQPGMPLLIEFALNSDETWQVEWKESESQKELATLRLRLRTV